MQTSVQCNNNLIWPLCFQSKVSTYNHICTLWFQHITSYVPCDSWPHPVLTYNSHMYKIKTYYYNNFKNRTEIDIGESEPWIYYNNNSNNKNKIEISRSHLGWITKIRTVRITNQQPNQSQNWNEIKLTSNVPWMNTKIFSRKHEEKPNGRTNRSRSRSPLNANDSWLQDQSISLSISM